MGEHRRYKRAAVKTPLIFHTRGREEKRGAGCVSNISLGGMLLETKEDLALGEPFVLSFLLGMKLRLTLTGTIVRKAHAVDVQRYGVKFTRLGFVTRWRLARYIEARVKLAP